MEDVVSVGLPRVSTVTVVAIVAPGPRTGIVETLSALSTAGVRPIIISLGDSGQAERREENGTIVIDGLRPRFLDNAVASLRLSSLPTLAWWRSGPEMLRELASLVDRVVLDVEDPSAVWPLVPVVAPLASVTDLRWARVTRWRDLMAQFFDLPEVRASANTFEHLEIAGSDPFEMRLLAGWLKARLPAGNRLEVVIDRRGSATVEVLRLSGAEGALAVRLLPGSPCLETSVNVGGRSFLRVVAVGDQRLLALIGEELRVRTRDLAFEEAVRTAERL